MDINLELDLSALTSQFTDWGNSFKKELYAAAAEGFETGGAQITQAMQAQVTSRLQIKNRSFAKSFRHRVYARKKNQPPLMIIGSKIPWVGLHETGGTINGKMLIPFGPRVSRKRFKQIVDTLMRSGNAFFHKAHSGRIFLFAENIAENDRALTNFKRTHRKDQNLKTLKRGVEIPIAELVTHVQLKKRLDLVALVQSRLPMLRDEVLRAAAKRLY